MYQKCSIISFGMLLRRRNLIDQGRIAEKVLLSSKAARPKYIDAIFQYLLSSTAVCLVETSPVEIR